MLINSVCDLEFHIHRVICMIVRHKENVLGSATNSDLYVSYKSFGRLRSVCDCNRFRSDYL